MKIRKLHTLMLVSVVTSSLIYASDSEVINLSEISVSANKMEENIQDVPQSITVIDEEILQEKGIKNAEGIMREIPNMTPSGSGGMGRTVSFRGLNMSSFSNSNPVVIYVDGVPYYDRYDFNPSLANVEQVEVLRGPQGTLYGKDSIGAVINIVSKQPKNEWSGSAKVEYAEQNYALGTLNTSGALVDDTFFVGINGQFMQDDGWITNDYLGMDKDANRKKDRKLSGFFLYKPTENLSAKLTFSNNYNDTYFINGYAADPSTVNISDMKRDDGKHVSFDVPTNEKTEVNSQSLNLSYDFNSVKLESTTTHKKFTLDGEYDADYLSNQGNNDGLKQFNNMDTTTITQELRLSSKNKEGIRWVSGLYFDTEERNQAPYGMEFYSPFPVPGAYSMNAESVSDSQTQAIFGQAMVPFMKDFELTLGGRYQHIKKKIDLNTYYLPVGTTGPAMYSLKDDRSWDAFLPKVALNYKINKDWTTYMSFTKGYMPGGYNFFASSGTADDNSFEPQQSTNYEVGIKGSFENISLAASIFRMDIEDIHVYKAVSASMWVTDNAKKAHSQGIELEITYYPTDTLEISGAFGIIDAKYDDYDTGVANYDGKNIESTPSHSANVSVAYFHPQGFYGRFDIRNQGEQYFFDGANNDMVKADGFTSIDAKAGYKISDWDMYLYVKNATNEDHVVSYMSKPGLAIAQFSEPRKIGIGARYSF
jgi:iron complex outermembrane receptor protein